MRFNALMYLYSHKIDVFKSHINHIAKIESFIAF